MKKSVIFIIVIFKLSFGHTPLFTDEWVVWDVGQGQWVTHIKSDECWHFDIGGEFGSYQKMRSRLIRNCSAKLNRIFLSHWDYDHFFNVSSAAKSLPKLCWQLRPPFIERKPTVQKVAQLQIPSCKTTGFSETFQAWTPLHSESTNDSSAVFFENTVLIPGDSPTSKEKIWVHQIRELRKSKILILGHHGSRTSSGTELLENLTGLLWSVSSARYKKYRHPHNETLKRLYGFHIPVLRTEDWGNIWFKP